MGLWVFLTCSGSRSSYLTGGSAEWRHYAQQNANSKSNTKTLLMNIVAMILMIIVAFVDNVFSNQPITVQSKPEKEQFREHQMGIGFRV